MNFQPVRHDPQALLQYSSLFAACFKGARNTKRFSVEQLDWLYRYNPDGLAIGFDAYENDELVAHYVLLPSQIRTESGVLRALLSLNTATHPDYRGQGLFTRLAEMAIEQARAEEFSAIYGVANANSTPGFVRRLGFELIAPLDARVGYFECMTLNTPIAPFSFERVWTPESLLWRVGWPANPLGVSEGPVGTQLIEARTGIPGLHVLDQITCESLPTHQLSRAVLNLYVGMMPGRTSPAGFMVSIPDWLKPSPLNLIFKSLDRDLPAPQAGRVRFSFLDFDAF
jgi:GNAT superfamily N-acetyltransferase